MGFGREVGESGSVHSLIPLPLFSLLGRWVVSLARLVLVGTLTLWFGAITFTTSPTSTQIFFDL